MALTKHMRSAKALKRCTDAAKECCNDSEDSSSSADVHTDLKIAFSKSKNTTAVGNAYEIDSRTARRKRGRVALAVLQAQSKRFEKKNSSVPGGKVSECFMNDGSMMGRRVCSGSSHPLR